MVLGDETVCSLLRYIRGVVIDRDIPVPPWRQLAAILRQLIDDGELTGRLGGERYMAAEYVVAVGTVRKALDLLRQEGLIETVHGWGSYVAGTRPQAGDGGY